MKRFVGFYDRERLSFIAEAMEDIGFVAWVDIHKIRKTATLLGEKLNVYIDTSDGVNEDLNIQEACDRVYYIAHECRREHKPFLIFKTSYSPVRSKDIIDYAATHNGRVLPFFILPIYEEFGDILLKNRQELMELNKKTPKTIDIGFYANLCSYYHPMANNEDPLLSWQSKKHFKVGNGVPTGWHEITTRRRLFEKFNQSSFSFAHKEKVDYLQFLHNSMSWKVCINPPGCGEYSPRILDHAALGQCVVLRKTSYDNAISWKSYLPEVDFNSPDWQTDLKKIIDNYEFWAARALEYYELVYRPEAMVKYMIDQINKFYKEKNL